VRVEGLLIWNAARFAIRVLIAILITETLPTPVSALDAGISAPVGSGLHPVVSWGPAENGFWLYQPHDGVPASLLTEVRAACNADSLMIRVDAVSEDVSTLVAPQVRRDQVQDDQDYVSVFIDPSGAGASAMFFRMGAGGSLTDGIYYASSNRQDLQPDFDVTVVAHRTDEGYSVTLSIPLSLLTTRGRSGGAIGYLVLRNVPGQSRRVFASSPLPINTANLISENRQLNTSECEKSAGTTLVGATYTVSREEVRTGSDLATERGSELGGEFQWSNDSTLSIDLTVNPDFSQVELDVPQLQSNTRFAINLPEKREFFYRDIDLFELPTRTSLNDGGGNQAFYSRTITDPDWGGRLAYRTEGRDVAFLAASDNGGGVVSLPGPFFTRFAFQPASQIGLARVSIEASPRLRYGTVAAHRQYDQGSNSIIGADLVWQASPTLRSRAMAIQSRTTASFDEDIHRRRSPGNYLFFDTLAMGSHWETAWTAERATKDFRNDIGYTPAADFMQVAGVITRRWRPLGAINNIGAALKVVDAQTVSTDETISRKIAPGLWFGGARDLDLLIEYVPNERRRTSGYGGEVHSTNQWNFRLGASLGRYVPSATLSLNTGDQIDYELDRVGEGFVTSLTARLRPLGWLELQPTVNHYRVEHGGSADRIEETTGQIIANAVIGPSSFIRYIGQSRSSRRYSSSSLGRPDALPTDDGWLLHDNRGVLHSLVCSLTLYRRWGVDFGVTRSQPRSLAEPRRRETSMFLKLEGNW